MIVQAGFIQLNPVIYIYSYKKDINKNIYERKQGKKQFYNYIDVIKKQKEIKYMGQ